MICHFYGWLRICPLFDANQPNFWINTNLEDRDLNNQFYIYTSCQSLWPKYWNDYMTIFFEKVDVQKMLQNDPSIIAEKDELTSAGNRKLYQRITAPHLEIKQYVPEE